MKKLYISTLIVVFNFLIADSMFASSSSNQRQLNIENNSTSAFNNQHLESRFNAIEQNFYALEREKGRAEGIRQGEVIGRSQAIRELTDQHNKEMRQAVLSNFDQGAGVGASVTLVLGAIVLHSCTIS